MEVKGRIHSFETFGTVDGPGIRFVVFMQGCPLRCVYCHNRDTWNSQGGNEFTVSEVMEKVLRYKSYMEASGGGITVSGGEPTLQPEFVTQLFRSCKESGIHTALDTSGFVTVDTAKNMLAFTDLVLLDIKHVINEKHLQITGVGNEKIQTFAQALSEQGKPVWIRYVLVPGFTDAEEDLLQAAGFIRTLKNVQKVEVLPYHSLGKYKWETLGEKYPLEGIQEPSSESIQKAREILESSL